jgi:phosphoribosylaminoimidazole (AIR) synthetase
VPGESAEKALNILRQQGEEAWILGEIIAGDRAVELA